MAKKMAPVLKVKQVPFKIHLDGAREVVLTGEFTGWSKDKIRLVKTSTGEWYTQLELAPGEYQYRLLVDGEWCDPPGASKKVPNPYGTQNCVLTVA
jgi:hypothetical protein